MESSKPLEGTEECGSCDSGWTMYIASPIHEDNNNEHDDDNDDDDRDTAQKGDDNDDDYESDNSMASDASSGPSHPELSYGSSKGGHTLGHSKYSKEKQVEKKICKRRMKAEKEVPGPKASSAADGLAHRGAKVTESSRAQSMSTTSCGSKVSV